jgi:putative nucleotidyltransferase with HDIG domain
MTGTKKGSSAKKKPTSKARQQGAPKPRPVDMGRLGGLLFLLGVIIVLSAASGVSLEHDKQIYVVGEIAQQDVTADQDFLVEDFESTERKRQQLAEAQPPVFDLSTEPAVRLEERVFDVVSRINAAGVDEQEQVRWKIAEEIGDVIAPTSFRLWQTEEFQNMVLGRVLPWAKKYLNAGVLADRRVVASAKNGILVRELDTGEEGLRYNTQSINDLDDFKIDLDIFLKNELDKSLRTRAAAMDLIMPLLGPSLTLNQETTEARLRQVVATVEPVYYQIKQGEIIVRKGERVDLEQQLKMQTLFSQSPSVFEASQAGGVFLFGMLFVLGLYLARLDKGKDVFKLSDAVFIGLVLLVFGAMAKGLAGIGEPLSQAFVVDGVSPDVFAYLLPTAGAAGVLALFFPQNVCTFAALLLSFLCASLAGGGVPLFVFYFLSGMFYTYFIKRAQTRGEVLGTLFPLLGAMVLTWGGVCLLAAREMPWAWSVAVAVVLNAMLSLLVVLSISTVAEFLFGYTSRFRLMELMSLEQPLLQELMVNAPGTYHHSLVVANMVEAGARAIGANSLLAKVAALYHDIGKLKNPHYFIENQFGQVNRHDKLTASMSALILIAHVKKGVELAKEHNLGQEIVDLIQQHHGTTLIRFFFHKAKEAESKAESLREEDFRYPGPKPQTKEAALLLLADAIEASSRSLVDPTPARIKGHIESLVKTTFTEGQLDESDLTLRELGLLTNTFHRILTGIFHQRIEYPAAEKTEGHQKLQPRTPDKNPPSEPDVREQVEADHPLSGEPVSAPEAMARKLKVVK